MDNDVIRPVPKPVDDSKLARRRAKGRGTWHEYATAKALGGRRTSRSGAGPGEKGDVSVDDLPTPLFVEVKYTGETTSRGSQTVSMRKEWFEKTIADALAAGKLPVVCLKLPDGTAVYATTADVFETLVAQLKLYYDRALGAGDERQRQKLLRIAEILEEPD